MLRNRKRSNSSPVQGSNVRACIGVSTILLVLGLFIGVSTAVTTSNRRVIDIVLTPPPPPPPNLFESYKCLCQSTCFKSTSIIHPTSNTSQTAILECLDFTTNTGTLAIIYTNNGIECNIFTTSLSTECLNASSITESRETLVEWTIVTLS
jgi:hypothetical protein